MSISFMLCLVKYVRGKVGPKTGMPDKRNSSLEKQ